MTTHTLRPCLEPGCPMLVSRGRCLEHELGHEVAWVYADMRWPPARLGCFIRDAFRCVECGYEDGTRTGAGLQANHVPKLRLLLAMGRDPFDVNQLETRCASCHSRVTASGE
jgi:5-methylcytosine-specific restriction endonuclease McrA